MLDFHRKDGILIHIVMISPYFRLFLNKQVCHVIQFNKINSKMRAGQQVLSKIQNLITQIDSKSKFFRARPPPQEQENKDSNNTIHNKLYEDYKVKQMKQVTKEQEKLNEESTRLSPFKVTNKHTMFINAQQQQKPIHERLQELQRKKEEQAERLRLKYPPKTIEYQDDDEVAREIEEKRRNQKKYSRQELEEKIAELQQKERGRLERLNRLKIKAIEEHSKDFRCKPYVGKSSESLWKRHQLKKQLSSSVFQRFEQYQMSRKTHMEETARQIRSKITPFAPRISQNSRLLASRTLSRPDLNQTLSRSHSCKCFQRSKPRKQHSSTAMHTSRKQ